MPKQKIDRLDRAGIWISLLCAIHCALLPLIMSLLPLAGFAFLQNHWTELILIGSAVLIAGLSLLSSFRQHRKPWPLIVVAIGFLLLWIGHHPESKIGWLWLGCGGLLIASAHWLNWRSHRACAH